MDIDATVVTACSEKEQACPTWKKTFGFHPLTAFADHGPAGSGDPLAIMLRPTNAGSDTAADHIQATRLSLAQLPARLRRRVLIRTDSGGGTREFLAWLTRPGRHLHYSVGFTVTDDVQDAVFKIPACAWTPAMTVTGRYATAPGSPRSPACAEKQPLAVASNHTAKITKDAGLGRVFVARTPANCQIGLIAMQRIEWT